MRRREFITLLGGATAWPVATPVGAGLVASLARPGGNLTGFTMIEYSMSVKLLEVLKEVAPQVARVAVILHPDRYRRPGCFAPSKRPRRRSGCR
jgi:hypothetical protein